MIVSAVSTARSTAPPVPVRRERQLFWRKLRESIFWYTLLAPSLIIIFGFSIVPMIWSIYYSFTKGGMLGKHPFVGFENYIKAA